MLTIIAFNRAYRNEKVQMYCLGARNASFLTAKT